MSITSIVNLAAGKTGDLLVEEAKFLYGVEDQVRSLQEEFTMMQSFLIDMEAMDEEEGDERSRTTIKQIRKIAYDAEDLIESYILEASSSSDKKEGFFIRYLCFCSSLLRTHQLGSEIEAIMASINKTMERWRKYMNENGIRVDARPGLNKTRVRMRPIAYSHTIEDHVIGFDEDINKLVGVLTNDEDAEIKVVSIVGMGGSGKTTLARKLYNHETVKRHFDCVAWVSVSQKWITQQILLDLLKKVGGETMQTGEPSLSHQLPVDKLYRYLEMKRYLIVLDDVWEDKALEDILPALPLGGDGKKIIFTTRKEEVVDYPNLKPHTYRHNPRRLSDEESWELFRKIALIHKEETSKSEELGKEMLKKCRGLPLAVIALAGILSQKENVEDWENVAKAVARRIMDKGKGTHLYGPVNEMLALTYIDLPRELKPCLLYLARYLEDHEIPIGMLMKLWIAEGFITSAEMHEGDTLEDVARRYVDELVHRCVVQVASRNYDGKVKTIQLHDLVRDLCIKKAKEENFLEIFTSTAPNSDIIVTKSHRVAIYPPNGDDLLFPTKSPHLRSLVYECRYKQDMSLEVIYQNFRLLRVLQLDNVSISNGTLPAGIGNLIHLRYLGLRGLIIRELPSSIGNLCNLLTLDCRNEKYIEMDSVRIPNVVWKIEGLRHLYLLVTTEKGVEALKLHTLKYLQTLYVGNVGFMGGNWMLEEFPRLSPSVKKLVVRGIRSEEQLQAAFQCPSIRRDRLHSLLLDWRFWGLELENLEPLVHCQHLRKLCLYGRIRDGLGSKIQLPANIKKLELIHARFEAEATLVALGKLPQLTFLSLGYKVYMGTKWTCSAGEFPQLKDLFLDAPNLEEWSIESGTMPKLSKLRVTSLNLRKVPEGLKFITTLQELLLDCNYELRERIKGGEYAHIIQHVPLVDVKFIHVALGSI